MQTIRELAQYLLKTNRRIELTADAERNEIKISMTTAPRQGGYTISEGSITGEFIDNNKDSISMMLSVLIQKLDNPKQ